MVTVTEQKHRYISSQEREAGIKSGTINIKRVGHPRSTYRWGEGTLQKNEDPMGRGKVIEPIGVRLPSPASGTPTRKA